MASRKKVIHIATHIATHRRVVSKLKEELRITTDSLQTVEDLLEESKTLVRTLTDRLKSMNELCDKQREENKEVKRFTSVFLAGFAVELLKQAQNTWTTEKAK